MVDQAGKRAIVEQVLTRAAEEIGDITGPVMERYYQHYPEAREIFQHHGGHGVENLQGDMVSQALYCLMWWYDSPGEIEFLVEKSVPHHSEELNVSKALYLGLLQATADVIGEGIPMDVPQQRRVWQELSQAIAALIEGSEG